MEAEKKKRSGIWEMIHRKFPSNEYAVLKEVRDMAGFYASRSADGIAINLWPSRGLHITGIELKSYRSDWLAEKKNPKKAEAIFKYCDYFYLITDDDQGDVVLNKEEIPETWGWIRRKGEKLITEKIAPKLTPEPVTRHFLAALIKRATGGMVPIGSIESRIKEAHQNGITIGEGHNTYDLKNAQEELEKLKKAVETFEKASGIKIEAGRWWYDDLGPEKLGAAVKFIAENGITGIEEKLTRLHDTAENITANIRTVMESFKKSQ